MNDDNSQDNQSLDVQPTAGLVVERTVPPRRWRNVTVSLGLVLAALGLAQRSNADTLYSVDVTDNTLVTIDTATGDVTTVGPTGGGPYSDVDLAAANCEIYALSTAPGHADLQTIDPKTGHMTASVAVRYAGSGDPVYHAEALGSLNDVLYAAVGVDTYSNNIGTLTTTGEFAGIYNYKTLDPEADCDGLCFYNGEMRWCDFINPSTLDVRRATLPPSPVLTTLQRYNPGPVCDDLAMSSDNQTLYLLDNSAGSKSLWALDPMTGLGGRSVVIKTTHGLFGLTTLGCGGPVPVTTSSWGKIKALYH